MAKFTSQIKGKKKQKTLRNSPENLRVFIFYSISGQFHESCLLKCEYDAERN